MKITIKNITIIKCPQTAIRFLVAVPVLLLNNKNWACVGEVCLFRDGKIIKANLTLQGGLEYNHTFPQAVFKEKTIKEIRLVQEPQQPESGVKHLKKYKQKSILE